MAGAVSISTPRILGTVWLFAARLRGFRLVYRPHFKQHPVIEPVLDGVNQRAFAAFVIALVIDRAPLTAV
jgi:hypothetical protein